MNLLLMTCGGAAPSAAPTPQKRGPWRPHGMGRQGRLPSWTASLRRAIPRYLLPYKKFVNALCRFLVTLNCGKLRPM